ISTIDILGVLSDDKALILFNAIALDKCYDFKTLIKNMGITQRQYCTRLIKMNKLGLIKRENGKYSTTALGNVVYEAISMVGKVLNYYWALKIIDSFQNSSSIDSMEHISKLMDILIDDEQIKKILTNTPTLLAS
ncbi:MAG: hypothetical protein ACRD8Z_01955, partial [Nitrososphaeraceae archaeon]